MCVSLDTTDTDTQTPPIGGGLEEGRLLSGLRALTKLLELFAFRVETRERERREGKEHPHLCTVTAHRHKTKDWSAVCFSSERPWLELPFFCGQEDGSTIVAMFFTVLTALFGVQFTN